MDLLLSIITSDWFVIVAIVWGITAISVRDKRSQLIETIADILTKPIIFQADPEPTSVRTYPRRFFETVAGILTFQVLEVMKRLVKIGKSWRKELGERFAPDESSFWKMMGSVVLLFLMVAFLFADLIAIFNTLDVLGLVASIPPIFRFYEFAVTLGSFFTIVLAGLLLIEIFGRPIFTDIANQTRAAKLILTWVAIALIFSGLAVAISLGLIRYEAISDPIGNILNADLGSFNDLVITVLVPANTILSTFLIVSEGLKGIPILILWITQIVVTAAVVVLFVFGVLNYPLWFSVDFIYRIILMCLYVIFFYVLTPLDKILDWKPFAGEEVSNPTNDKPTTKDTSG
jgi:hypothetical protein